MQIVSDIRGWLDGSLSSLKITPECRAYVVSVLASSDDLSDQPVSILYLESQLVGDVNGLLQVGDWGLRLGALEPSRIFSNGGLLFNLSRDSYYSCHLLMSGAWPVLKELGDKLEYVVEEGHTVLFRSGIKLPTVPNSRGGQG